jgi:hypothetical protein
MSDTIEMRWLPFDALPPDGERPGRIFVRVEGWRRHSDITWYREHCGMARTQNGAGLDAIMDEDRSRIMRDGDMDGIDRITHWMPARFPGVGGEA